MPWPSLTLGLVVFAAASTAAAQMTTVRAIDVTDFGVFSYEMESRRINPSSDIQVTQTLAHNMRIDRTTSRIPITPGLAYGVGYIVRGEPIGATVQIDIVRHERCVLANGTVSDKRTAAIAAQIGQQKHTGFRFKLPGEERVGCTNDAEPETTTIELYHQGRRLAEKTFQYRP